jgi:hypothetical protein
MFQAFDRSDTWLVPVHDDLHIVTHVTYHDRYDYHLALDLHTADAFQRLLFFDRAHVDLLSEAVAALQEDLQRLMEQTHPRPRHLTRLLLPANR